MIQETPEEAAERIFNIPEEKNGDVYFGSKIAHLRKGFKFGAKWMQDRMYSEEDMREAFRGFSSGKSFKEWFEQFSKLKNG